jgi:UDP:flavonoid glycosyltransferase YjiC (YdhE family)
MRCLFCSFASPGYLFPLVGLARELVRRGHVVAFATGPEGAEVLEAAGVRRIARGEPDGRSFQVATWGNPVATAVDVKHAEHAVSVFAPDLLVSHQLCQAALLVRERTGLPLAVLGLFGYSWPSSDSSAASTAFASEGAARLESTRRWRLGDNLRTLNEARALFRLSPVHVEGGEGPLLGDRFLLRTTAGLDPELPRLPARVHAAGACLWEPPEEEGDAWAPLRARLADPEAPLLYVQPGRTFGGPGFWPVLLEAVAGRPLQVVASVGRMDAPAGSLPPNVHAAPHVPQGLVLPRARAAVYAPTTSAVLAALAHAVPGIAVPSGSETPDNAARLAALGCALALEPEGLSAATLGDALSRVLNDGEMRSACRRARRALGDPGDFTLAADHVERLGAPARPPSIDATSAIIGAPADALAAAWEPRTEPEANAVLPL